MSALSSPLVVLAAEVLELPQGQDEVLMSACVQCMGLGKPRHAFFVTRKVNSQNGGGHNGGAAMHAYRRERDAWIRDLYFMVKSGGVTEADGRRVVRITRDFAGRCRKMDYGNLVGGLKPVVDAMQREIGGKSRPIKGAGIIIDDSPDRFIGIYEQRRGDIDGVTFEVWDLPDK